MATATIRECIVDSDKTRKIPDSISAGHSQYGMMTFDQSLMTLYRRSLISYEESLLWASNPDDFALRVRGIEPAWEQVLKGSEEDRSNLPGMERLSG